MAYCSNQACPAQGFQALKHFVSRSAMDIRGLGARTLLKLQGDQTLTDVADIYQLDAAQIGALEGFKEKSVANMQAAIEASKAQPFSRVL